MYFSIANATSVRGLKINIYGYFGKYSTTISELFYYNMIICYYPMSALRTTHSRQDLELQPSYYSTTIAQVDRSKLPHDRLGYQYSVPVHDIHFQT
jgi:hypothetical protein